MEAHPLTSNSSRRPILPPPVIVDSAGSVPTLIAALRSAPRLAADTEANSLFAYQERVCLIQVSVAEADFIIDPLARGVEPALAALGEAFSSPKVEKILHAAEYDIMTLRRDLDFQFANLFDTMIAARILGKERVGLGAMLEEYIHVTLDKRHQRANWGKRPLTLEMIRYAQMDTHYLLALRDHLYEELIRGDHWEEARELFDEVARAEWGGMEFDPQGYWRLNGASTLSPREAAVLEALYHFRQREARKRDLPMFKVLPDEALINLALACPAGMDDLSGISGLTHGLIERFGRGILEAVRIGLSANPPTRPPRVAQVDEAVQRRFEALHAWRKERAARRGVSSEVVLSKDALWELAQVAPRTLTEMQRLRSLGPWRLKTYGSEILKVLVSVDGYSNHQTGTGA